ncbi:MULTISPECIES: hemin uptake protein HemP [Nitratireductor]|uniref:hemin uptake protein HemP n=1 Tax=Nitratireductor sp. StC3 TaxID=2126741 RepID=UPI001EE91FFA|nr:MULTISPECIES: hemin uptake protein HemP [Nitratireductor]
MNTDRADIDPPGHGPRAALRSGPDTGRQKPHPRIVTSEALFGGAQEIAIEHGDALYRLKITRQGKLILNK